MCFLFYSERGCVSVIRTLGWRIQIRLNSFVKWSLTSIMGHVVLYRFWVVLFQRSCFLMPTFSQLFSIKCSITGYTSFKVLPDSTGTCSLCVFVLWHAYLWHYTLRQAVMSTFPNSVQLYLASELIWPSHPLVFQPISFSYHFFSFDFPPLLLTLSVLYLRAAGQAHVYQLSEEGQFSGN